MRPRNRGAIIQVGSALAYRSIPLQAAYCGAKHAIRGFTDSLRSELLHDKIDIDVSMVQLPAVNTPQFGWCVNKMAKSLEPVPPMFQPEIIADSIYFVSRHPRREVFIGWPTIKAVIGNKLVPGFADHYLASHGWEGQLTDRPNTNPPANLFEPVPGDQAAHGIFDAKSRSHDVFATVGTVLGAGGVQAVIAAGAVALAALVGLGALGLARRRS
jgi:hypothetical protein